MENSSLNSDIVSYFALASNPSHRQYLALRMFFLEGASAKEVALKYGYSLNTVYSLVRDFKQKAALGLEDDPFFKHSKMGRPRIDVSGEIKDLVTAYRKQYMSVPEIKSCLDAIGICVSERYINSLLKDEGFARLPRRERSWRTQISNTCSAPKSEALDLCVEEEFSSQLAGILLILPIIRSYGIDALIDESPYPYTKVINRTSSILSFVALKLSDIGRYSEDDTWCMDRGMGLFASLNVLPKAAWFSSYSSSVTREMNLAFLNSLRKLMSEKHLLSDTMNLDFTAIPYFGDDDPFENNWSGTRSRALASIQAVLAQDPDSGLLCYSDTTIRHKNQSDTVLEFLDFFHPDPKTSHNLKYLVFDSRFTTYENLGRLNQKGIKFITIQRRSKNLSEKIHSVHNWKKIRVMRANGKGRVVEVYEDKTMLKGCEGQIRQVFIKGKDRVRPAIMITNDFDIPLSDLIRKYSKRWLVEKDISEQIHFFHLNRNSSGIVVKVDFDLVMTILAHNLYRLFVSNIDGYSHCEAKTVFNKFIHNAGVISVKDDSIEVKLKKKRTLPLTLERMEDFKDLTYPWLGNKRLVISASTTT